jgi:hypothetical protein
MIKVQYVEEIQACAQHNYIISSTPTYEYIPFEILFNAIKAEDLIYVPRIRNLMKTLCIIMILSVWIFTAAGDGGATASFLLFNPRGTQC